MTKLLNVRIENSYHDTVEIVQGESLEEVKQNYIGGLEVKAEWLTENEIEEDWEDYYSTFEDAFNASYELTLEQLISEVTFIVLK